MKNVTLFGRKISEYTIVCPASSTKNERFAAQELAKYLSLTAGGSFTVAETADRPRILVGAAACSDRHIYTGTHEEGFSLEITDGEIRMEGGVKRGALYCVYTFLEDYLGWCFLTNDSEYLKDGDVSVDSPVSDTQIPVFEWRDVCSTCLRDTAIAAKRKLNSSYLRDFSEEQGGSFYYPGRFIHTMESLLGVPQHSQPCFTDEENIKKCIESVRALLRANPEARVISLSQNDGDVDEHIWCDCERCRALDEAEGSHAASLLYFVNKVAEAVEDEFPKVKLMTLAYIESIKCPKTMRPRKNVIVEFAPITLCYIHGVDDECCQRNRELMKDFEDWSEITDQIYLWDYIVNFSFSVPLFPNFHVLQKNMRYYLNHSVTGMFCEGDNYHLPNACSDLSELRAYLLSKLLWKPDMSEEEFAGHRRDFLLGYYGRGGEEIGKYIDMMTAIVNIPEHHIHCFNNPTTLVPMNAFIEKIPELEAFWVRAAELAEGDAVSHVERSRLQFDQLKIMFTFDEEYEAADEEKRRELVAENRRFYETLTRYDVHPRGEHSEIPHLTDFTQNMGKKIYW